MASTGTFELSGLHCDGCKKMIEKKVCAMPDLETCSVELLDAEKQTGRITLKTKEGVAIDPAKVTELVKAAGKKYEITSQTIK